MIEGENPTGLDNTEVQEFRSSGVQEFRSSRVQDFPELWTTELQQEHGGSKAQNPPLKEFQLCPCQWGGNLDQHGIMNS
ncbi:MAG TPA: hypothetical protein DC064_13225 [Cyanobacteria bacterium UBA9273]|nr:hypothetical protein [Cyanobacteria bacterium UBA9273]